MSGPGGNNPLNFGKSKAKFQMEPNTGITFADVAGVEEAKADFMEVGFNVTHYAFTVICGSSSHCCSLWYIGVFRSSYQATAILLCS